MDELKEKVRGYAEQALKELVEEGPTQPEVELVAVECEKGEGGRTTCTLGFHRRPASFSVAVRFELQQGDGTPEGERRANVDEIKRAFNKKVYGT